MVPCTACTIKTSQTLLQVQEDDQSSLPMSLVASLDTVPVTCCVPLQEKIDKWARNRRTCQGINRWVVNPESHELEKCTHTHRAPCLGRVQDIEQTAIVFNAAQNGSEDSCPFGERNPYRGGA